MEKKEDLLINSMEELSETNKVSKVRKYKQLILGLVIGLVIGLVLPILQPESVPEVSIKDAMVVYYYTEAEHYTEELDPDGKPYDDTQVRVGLDLRSFELIQRLETITGGPLDFTEATMRETLTINFSPSVGVRTGDAVFVSVDLPEQLVALENAGIVKFVDTTYILEVEQLEKESTLVGPHIFEHIELVDTGKEFPEVRTVFKNKDRERIAYTIELSKDYIEGYTAEHEAEYPGEEYYSKYKVTAKVPDDLGGGTYEAYWVDAIPEALWEDLIKVYNGTE